VRLASVLLATLIAVLPAAGAAAPFIVPLGQERITLDAPPGFSDTTFLSSPRLQELAESLTSASNRILVFAMTDADLRRFMAGDRPDLRRYVAVATPRGLERERVNESQFRAFVADSLRELGTPAVLKTADFQKFLETQPVGKANLLAELKNQPNMVSILQGARLPNEGGLFNNRPVYVLATTTLFLLRGKALQLAVYSGYESPGDVEWITSITERWVEELQRLNR
jgi:hypothetical protein